MTMKTLVVHPSDRTTDFLETIYRDLDAVVIRGNVRDRFLVEQITAADRVYMLGHGMPQGLLGHGTFMVGDEHAELLRSKTLVGVWCNANVFFEKHNLKGLYTGMIVSERGEADIFIKDGKPSIVDINESNVKLAHAVKEALEVFDPEHAAAQAIEDYTRPRQGHWNNKNLVIDYNKQNIFDSENTPQLVKALIQGGTVCGNSER